ncbi:DNA polymerase V subunit UmuD [Gallibacterium salpingitidis]|uniref:DNA polymerase V subunit UmuD n=1 Tax=Gallibacterium salpingitidis TaxID=505341 RepID=A0A1A7Q880_9PAST|nr:S24 family peptidase [Gallibacterium salpingitidis]OBW95786.1 DNA polymerase V subunit UmuD [Gallibacterium salpingitidis]OBX09635.1 DNA polymerase V subunit UmuD [Gallibacterium salpingitidis]
MQMRIDNVFESEQKYSYLPLPLYDDNPQKEYFNKRSNVHYRMDLNLYCIKKPQETFFLRVINENLTAWGIDTGDMLIIEKTNEIHIGDLVVIEQDNGLQLYEFFAEQEGKFVFFSLDSRYPNLKVTQMSELNIQGTVVSTIHRLQKRRVA